MVTIHQQLMELTKEEEQILNTSSQNVDRQVYTDKQEFIIERSKFLAKNKLIVTRKHPRFIAFPTHRHDYIELNYVYHGKLTQKVGQERFELRKGELLFLNQHIEHALDPCGKEDLVINFIIDPRFFDHMFQSIDIDGSKQPVVNFLISSLFNQNHSGSYLYFKVSDIVEIQSIIEKMIEEMMNPSILSEVTVKFYMGLLIVNLIKHSDKAYTRSNQLYDYEIISAVLRYIDDSFRKAKLEEVAKKLKMSNYNLSKQIKKRTGQTFKAILQERRLKEAKLLLDHTELAIDQVASEVGYENVSYFYRLFKEKYACTPREYRKKVQHPIE